MSIFTPELLIEVVELYNPWWKTKSVPNKEKLHFKRNAFYLARNSLFDKENTKGTLLYGIRRIGKATIMYQLIDELLEKGISPDNILFFSFDNPIIKIADIDGMLKTYKKIHKIEGDLNPNEEYYLFIDEIQYSHKIGTILADIIKTNPKIHIVATSSACPEFDKKDTSHHGLFNYIPMNSLSFYEYCELLNLNSKLDFSLSPNDFVVENTEKITEAHTVLKKTIVPHFKRFLYLGGFPKLALQSNKPDDIALPRADIVSKVVRPDLSSVYNIRNTFQMEKVFLYGSLCSGGVINIERMSKELGDMNKISLHNYIHYMRLANLIQVSEPVPAFGYPIYKSRPKVYMANAAIRNSILLTDKDEARPHEFNSMIEGEIFKQLSKSFDGQYQQIGYCRNPLGNHSEIDIMIDFFEYKYLCEVQYLDHVNLSENDLMFEMSNSFRSNAEKSVLVTKDLSDFGPWYTKTRTPIYRVAAPVYLYMISKNEREGILAKYDSKK